jgi:hypothetical protein
MLTLSTVMIRSDEQGGIVKANIQTQNDAYDGLEGVGASIQDALFDLVEAMEAASIVDC